MIARRRLATLVATWLVLLGPAPSAAQQAADVYARFSASVMKVEMLEESTRAPATVGTAFFAGERLLLTNYHVVRELLFEPEGYLLRLVDRDGVERTDVEVVAVDPVHDLAVLRVVDAHAPALSLTTEPVPNGESLFSLGHPADLRTSVVEGAFNGEVEHAFASLFHFSGSINPGMSGGPTVREDGSVVGINVSSAGNQLSFLVPAARAVELLETVSDDAAPGWTELREQAGRQLHAFQQRLYGRLLGEDGLQAIDIRETAVPSGPEDLFDCSATPHDVTDDRYEIIEYRCDTEDDVLLGRQGSFDLIYLEHLYLAKGELSRLAFTTLFSEWYTTILAWEAPENDEATAFECRDDNLEAPGAAEILIAFCMRRHLPHEGLYDLVVRTALLGGGDRGIVSTLRASPISFDNAVAVTEQWLEGFAWNR